MIRSGQGAHLATDARRSARRARRAPPRKRRGRSSVRVRIVIPHPHRVQRHDLDGGVGHRAQKLVERRAPPEQLQRERALWPKMTWVTPSRCANAISPSAGRSAFTRTTVAPRLSARRMFCCSARHPGGRCGRLLAGRLDVDGVPFRAQPAGDAGAGPDDPRRQRRSSSCRPSPARESAPAPVPRVRGNSRPSRRLRRRPRAAPARAASTGCPSGRSW